jgi:Uma2 family endonuclease
VIHARRMPALTIKLPVRGDQTEFNLRRWGEMTGDTALGRELARIEGRIETDRHGRVILLGPSEFLHGCYQAKLAFRLDALLMGGTTVIACPISTADGVKAADVAWVSRARRATSLQEDCLTQAPEICVEILSSSCSRVEMNERKALFFDAGAEEVWFCDQAGEMTFYCAPHCGASRASIQCPEFPKQISL